MTVGGRDIRGGEDDVAMPRLLEMMVLLILLGFSRKRRDDYYYLVHGECHETNSTSFWKV